MINYQDIFITSYKLSFTIKTKVPIIAVVLGIAQFILYLCDDKMKLQLDLVGLTPNLRT